jgi:phosphoserine phosphatase
VDRLPSWNEGAPRAAILDFVDRVTREGGDDFVPAPERIAVVDNDGTLWCERPAYVQALFLLGELRAQTAERPELADQPVVVALLAGDLHAAAEHGPGAVAEVLMRLHAGLTAEEFIAAATTWFADARHARFGVRFDELAYVPMLELLALLRAHDFHVFVVTGGGVEFVRAVSERIYDVPPDDVVGSAVQVRFERRGGRVVLVREAKLLGSPNEGPPKVVNIQSHIGRRPILAAGNSAGDREMLEYAHTGELPSLCLVIDHDDAQREYAYTGESVTDPGADPIADTAAAQGWTTVSMRDDWSRVFAADGKP